MSEIAFPVSSFRVKDYMTPNPTTLGPEDRLLDADLAMRNGRLRHLPVVSDGCLVGLLSERDVRRCAPSILQSAPEQYNELFERTVVMVVMSKEVVTIHPEASLAEAAQLMHVERLGCLPVVEGERLVGIVTRDDIVRFAHDVLCGTIRDRLEAEGSGATSLFLRL